MGEADEIPGQNDEAAAVAASEKKYRNAREALLAYVKKDVTTVVNTATDVLKNAIGVGSALDTVIREHGTFSTDEDLKEQYTFSIPFDFVKTDTGERRQESFIAKTDGVVVSLFDGPLHSTDHSSAQGTFLTLPVDDLGWNNTEAETPSIKLGDAKTVYPLRVSTDKSVARVYASALRQAVEKLTNAVPAPPSPPEQGPSRHARPA